jgi:hypothetical protein
MQIDNVSILLHVQNNYDNWFFIQTSLSNVHHSFSKLRGSKLKRILTLMITKAKTLEIGNIHLKTHLNIFVLNMLLILKIMIFENVCLTKIIHFVVV